jgi:hypothetical protein
MTGPAGLSGMSGLAGLFGLLGAGAGLGLLLLARGAGRHDAADTADATDADGAGPDEAGTISGFGGIGGFGGFGGTGGFGGFAGRLRRVRPPWRRDRRFWQRVAGVGAAGVLAGAWTGWVAGGLLAALAVWGLPRLLGGVLGDGAHARRVARTEAVAVWAEMLRDTLAAAAGLEQAVLATAATAPAAVQPEVAALAARIEGRQRLAPALRAFADDLADPVADLVVAALVLACEHQARQLSGLLGQLADTARAQVEMHRRIDVGRARVRATVRVVVATSLLFALGLAVFNRAFLAPYDSPAGQTVLLLVGAVFAGGFALLRRMARIDEPDRLLAAGGGDGGGGGGGPGGDGGGGGSAPAGAAAPADVAGASGAAGRPTRWGEARR